MLGESSVLGTVKVAPNHKKVSRDTQSTEMSKVFTWI